MPYDYSSAIPPRDFEPIPEGTIAVLQIKVCGGGAGEDGLLKRSKDGACEMLHLEFTVIDEAYRNRKFWEYFILSGEGDNYNTAAEISRVRLRRIIESAKGIQPTDLSPQARAARTVENSEFDGLCFIGKIGIEKGKLKNKNSGEFYADKNVLVAAITPDQPNWHPVTQSPTPPPASPSTSSTSPTAPVPATIARPTWAK